ncbi:unnamed protein product [Citrullus colocynthis]|uniref:Uncharacterized protein n=1 Tax=Citrullus colocynthis TaxID=252529 RepID=A0ABP0YEZ7_9ROSI
MARVKEGQRRKRSIPHYSASTQVRVEPKETQRGDGNEHESIREGPQLLSHVDLSIEPISFVLQQALKATNFFSASSNKYKPSPSLKQALVFAIKKIMTNADETGLNNNTFYHRFSLPFSVGQRPLAANKRHENGEGGMGTERKPSTLLP